MHLGCVVAEVLCCACALGVSKDRTTGVSLHHNAAPPHRLLTTAMPMLVVVGTMSASASGSSLRDVGSVSGAR